MGAAADPHGSGGRLQPEVAELNWLRNTSLRARLLLGILAVVTCGLLAASYATYAALESFLEDRIDGQLQDSRNPVLREMARGGLFPVPSSGDNVILSGTYGEYRKAGFVPRVYSSDEYPKPDLPTELPSREAYFNVGSEKEGHRYRVLSSPIGRSDPGGVLAVALPLDQNEQTLRRLVGIEIFVGVGVLAALTAMTVYVVRLSLRPLDAIGQTADAIAAGDLSRRVERAEKRTEVGRLGLALNAMLGHIEDAFARRRASEERLRQFVADASHELRTPLTSIRGYAELFRRGAADRPEDLAMAMRRIEEESARMSGLVEDLLLLARLDEGRPLEREPVNLARLAADAVADVRAVDAERPVTLELVPEAWAAPQTDPAAAPGVVVLGDEARLRQVAANLLNNARVHTPAGTPVHVRVVAADGRARLEVRDEGPGMDPGDAERVFERFFRADKARARATGGSGLGLSIVAAIAEAHGGRAGVDPGPGRGATFIVELPLHNGTGGGVHRESTERSQTAYSRLPFTGTDIATGEAP